MLSKKVIIVGFIATTLFIPLSFAAAASPDGDNSQKVHEQKRQHKASKEAAGVAKTEELTKFFEEYQKSENELFDKIQELSSAEAEVAINKFYNEAFEKMPTRKNRTKEQIVKAIDGMDIPHDIKAEVLAKIDETASNRQNRMKERSISFAKSLIDMPEEEREEDIANHNLHNKRRLERMLSKTSGRKHNKMRGMGMMQGKGMMQCPMKKMMMQKNEGNMQQKGGMGMMQGKGRMQGQMMQKKGGNMQQEDGMGMMQGRGKMKGMGDNNAPEDMQDNMSGRGMMCPMMKMMMMHNQEKGKHHKFKNTNHHNDSKTGLDQDNNEEEELEDDAE